MQIAKTPENMPKEIPSLNGIRAISILIVLVGHSGFSNVPGGLGVTIFFFLSGYLITTLMLTEHQRTGRINILSFYARRFFRLVPPLIITLMVAYGLVHLRLVDGSATIGGLASQLFYFANYFMIFFDPLGQYVPGGTPVLWSLAVEEHFYIVYPLFMTLCLAYIAKRQDKRQNITLALVFLCAAVLCWRIYLTHSSTISELRIIYGSDTRIDSIVYGCILAIAFNPVGARRENERMSWAQWCLVGTGMAGMLVTLLYRDDSFRETFRYSVQGIALMPLFYFAIRFYDNTLFRWLNSTIMTKIGIWSYAVYLIHHVIIHSLRFNFPAVNRWTVLFLALVVSMSFAALMDRFVDSYFRTLRRNLRPASHTLAAQRSQ